ncbi:unnamed protein product [Ilex paraguariensis]|uniref:Uncharacterized protein n=1 Tax=Ilex paraguariensis TaxID=185542 RepID=A0ABC8UI07_9AQUA
MVEISSAISFGMVSRIGIEALHSPFVLCTAEVQVFTSLLTLSTAEVLHLPSHFEALLDSAMVDSSIAQPGKELLLFPSLFWLKGRRGA